MRGREGVREYLIELLEWNGNVAFFNYNRKLDAEHKTLTATTTTAAVVVPSTFYFQPVSIVFFIVVVVFRYFCTFFFIVYANFRLRLRSPYMGVRVAPI